MTVDWQIGPDGEKTGVDVTAAAGDAALNTIVGAPPPTRSRRLLLFAVAALAVLAGGIVVRAIENHRVFSQVERDVEAVYRLELDALAAGDVDLLLELQTLRRAGDARFEAITGPLGPLPSVELAGESEIADISAIPADKGGGPDGSRRIERAEVTIRHWAAGEGEFLEHRLYVLDEDGAWRHERIPPPERARLETVPGLRWIVAAAAAEDLEIVEPALHSADSVLAAYCPTRCPEPVQLRFSGNLAGRITTVATREGREIALPSPTLTLRPGDEAGEQRYARAIAELVLLRAAGQDVNLEREYERAVTGRHESAPFVRDALREAFLAGFGLGDERPPLDPPTTDFGSIWNLWWYHGREAPWVDTSDASGASDGERANAARHLVDELVEDRGADADALLHALEETDSPDDWLEAVLGRQAALEVIAEWPSPPPPFPADRALALICPRDTTTWLVHPGGEAIDVGPACPDGFMARHVAWSSDAKRLAIGCVGEMGVRSGSNIVIVDADTLRPLVSLPYFDESMAGLAWAENGRLVWSSWERTGLSPRWAWPEEGAEIESIPSDWSFTPNFGGDYDGQLGYGGQLGYTWGADGTRVLTSDPSGRRREVHMFDLDAPDQPLWSLFGSTAHWDGRSERIAVLTPPVIIDVGGRDAATGVSAPADVGAATSAPFGAAEIAIVDAQSGASIARRTLDTAEVEAAISAAVRVGERRTEGSSDLEPNWHAASLVGIAEEAGLVAVSVRLERSDVASSPVGEAISGSIIIWPTDLDGSPTALRFSGQVQAMWLDTDHPDAPPDGDGPAFYVVERDPVDMSMGFWTIRTTGESRRLDRLADQVDPDGLWRFRMRSGRAEMRRIDDESLAWWLNSPACDRVRWAGAPSETMAGKPSP